MTASATRSPSLRANDSRPLSIREDRDRSYLINWAVPSRSYLLLRSLYVEARYTYSILPNASLPTLIAAGIDDRQGSHSTALRLL